MINRENKELLSKIKNKLKEYPEKHCEEVYEDMAKEILELIPEELEVNLYEWLENKSLTDIYIKELSINLLFKVWQGRRDFYGAIYEIARYKKFNYISTSAAFERYSRLLHIY